MPRHAADRAPAHARHWDARLRSRAFKRALTDLVRRELTALAGEAVGEVVDAELVRTMIRELDTRVIDRAIVADLVVEGNRRMGARLTGHQQSLLALLDRRLVADLDAALQADMALSPRAEEFVATLMRQEFVRSLLTDVIYTAIVSFHARVNPFFGALATRALEDQIKGFIRLFMPTLQAQAVAFAIDRGNQRIVLEFARAVVRQLLDVPVGRYADLLAPADGGPAEALIRRAVKNARLGSLARRAALAVWDDLYASIAERPLGTLLRLDEHADWLAKRCVEVLLPALSRPHVRRFIAAEIALATTAAR